jgi:hypothetical protein
LSSSFYVVLFCVGRGLATSWSLVQGVLPCVETDKGTKKNKSRRRSKTGLLNWDCYLDFIHRPYVFKPQLFSWGRVKNHPLNRCGLNNIRAMDKVQITDPRNTAPSSKIFRDEFDYRSQRKKEVSGAGPAPIFRWKCLFCWVR